MWQLSALENLTTSCDSLTQIRSIFGLRVDDRTKIDIVFYLLTEITITTELKSICVGAKKLQVVVHNLYYI